MARALRILLKILLGTAAAAVSVAVLLVLIVLLKPGILLNDRTLGWTRAFLSDRDIAELEWSEGHLRAGSESLLSKRVELSLRGACYDGAVKACFSSLDVALVADLGSFPPVISRIGPIDGRGGRLLVRDPGEQPGRAEPGQDEEEGFALPAILKGARLAPIRIGLERWEIERRGSSPLSGSAELEAGPKDASGTGAFVRADLRGLVDGMRLGAKLDLAHPRLAGELFGWKGTVQARAGLGERRSATLDARLSPLPKEGYRYAVDASYREGPGRASAAIAGEATAERLKGELKGRAERLIPSIRKAWTGACRFDLERRPRTLEGARFEGRVGLDCPVHAQVPIAPKKGVDFKIPSEAGVEVRAELSTLSFPPSPSERVNGEVAVTLIPILTPLFEGNGRVNASIDGAPTAFPEDWRMDTDLGLALRIPSFRRLVKLLEPTDWAIWAPLRVLRGSLGLELTGRFDAIDGSIPLALKTRLRSPSQRLDIDASGRVDVAGWAGAPRTRAEVDVTLSDFMLELPRLDLAAPPRFFPDKRVKSFAKADEEKQKAGTSPEAGSLEYRVRVRTPADRPARILSNLARAPIPIALDLRLSSEAPLEGEVRVQSFPVEFFRRKAVVERLKLDVREPSDESPIDGSVRMDLTDYQVRVIAVGTAGRPAIRFESDPPLSQEQIISLLLYGRTPDDLDAEESSSVGSAQAAVQDRALGLLSFFVLGSTPIQSLGYDPRTGRLDVKVRLGEGTSLNLGGGSEEGQNVGVRRRLTRNWSITTELSNPSGSGTS
ncbi:MAG TPA: translocation/assembly module TamB domain-containing protein, partial [Bdellovibrionota bacterium]|nr:translocation/assembly module TamB domain-containing protein [Bdellovibrionota bacterium]